MALWKESSQEEQFLSSKNKDSLIAADVTIEGKIEGEGPVRIMGCFKGEINVKGHLTIEPGAHVSGEIRAETIVVGGEVEGNIHAVARVELLESALVSGDLKASSLAVAAGSCMRGKVEFGWDGRGAGKVVPIEGGKSGL